MSQGMIGLPNSLRRPRPGMVTADLCEPDAAPPRPVAQQGQRFAKHPADGFDGRLFRQRHALGVMQLARQAANADAEPLAGQLEGRKRAEPGRVSRHATRSERASPSDRRHKGQGAALPRSGLRPSGQTGCATGSPRTGARLAPAAAGTSRRTGADESKWQRASAADFSAAPAFPSLSSFLLSVRICARSVSTVKRLRAQMPRLVVVRGSKMREEIDQAFGAVPSGHSGNSAFGSYQLAASDRQM